MKEAKHAGKHTRGSAYIMVVSVSMAILTMVLAVLLITAASRRVTARYSYFFGLYDLAVLGNQQAFYLLEQGLLLHSGTAHAAVQARLLAGIYENPGEYLMYMGDVFAIVPPERYLNMFVEEIAPLMLGGLAGYFTPVGFDYQRVWRFEIDFATDDVQVQDSFWAATTISRVGNGFRIDTEIYKYQNSTPGPRALIRSTAAWPDPFAPEWVGEIYVGGAVYIDCLDRYMLTMVDLHRVAD